MIPLCCQQPAASSWQRPVSLLLAASPFWEMRCQRIWPHHSALQQYCLPLHTGLTVQRAGAVLEAPLARHTAVM